MMEEWSWRIGMLILSGVPAIVGGGIIWSFFEKWLPVVVWEVVLLFIMSQVLYLGDKRKATHAEAEHAH